jgi:tetratricopeptide (TPR) repeat protein
MTTKSVLLFFFFLYSANLIAQPGWVWPTDSADSDKAKEYYALYSDLSKAKNQIEALPYLEWLLDKAPKLNVALYIGATSTYEDLADAETDPAKKLAFQEKTLEVYDKRIEYFGNEGEVLNRKAFASYRYFKDNKAKYPELIELFTKANRLNGIDAFDNNLIAFMDVLKRTKLSGGTISDQEILGYYGEISDILNAKIEKESSPRLIQIQEAVDQLLVGIVPIDCGFVENTLGPKIKQDPSDLKTAKKLFHLLLTGKCTDSPLFYESAEIIQTNEPSYGIARVLAGKRAAEGDYENALKYYNQALDLTDENEKKAETSVDIAKVYSSRGEKALARGHAVKAIGYDQNLAEAYNLIGNLYYHSYEDCKEGVSRVKDRAVFIAAYDMYRKAGNAKGMEEAKSQFPSIGEIFEEGMQEGDKIALSCWVKESVVLQKR